MKLRPLAALALFFLSLAVAWPAQPQGARDPEGAIVDELVVNAPALGGPAFWTVSRGGSKVFILGVPASLPKGLKWDTRRLEQRLKGANAFITPPQVRVSILKGLFFFLQNRKAFQSAGPMEQTLPPALRDRFVAARQGLGKAADRYAKWKPAVAAMFLAQDFGQAAHLSQDEPLGKVRSLARRAGVGERRAASYDAMPLLKSMTALSLEAHQACLADSVDQVQAGSARIQAAAQGWARGDVKTALTAERGFDRCLALVPGVSGLLERSMTDTAGAVAVALQKPGYAVAVVELRQLLAKGGVLEQLRAQGFKIETPAG